MKTPGEQIITALLERPERRHFSVLLERKAGPILGAPPNPMPVPRVITGPVVPLRMRDLIAGGTTEADSIAYARETSITNSVVVPVGAGGLKPQADLTYVARAHDSRVHEGQRATARRLRIVSKLD
jgi:hypothetical protein